MSEIRKTWTWWQLTRKLQIRGVSTTHRKPGNLERVCKVMEIIITCKWWQRTRNQQICEASRKYWKSGKFELDENLPEPVKTYRQPGNMRSADKVSEMKKNLKGMTTYQKPEKYERGDNVPATRKYVECRQRVGDHRKLTGWQRVGNQVNLKWVSTHQKPGNTWCPLRIVN